MLSPSKFSASLLSPSEAVEHSRRGLLFREVHGTATPTASFGSGPSRSALVATLRTPAGARCAILASNSPDWVAVYLGIVAAGHTAVPLDTAFNGEQVEKLLRDCGASLIFADAKTSRRPAGKPGHPLKVVLIDDALHPYPRPAIRHLPGDLPRDVPWPASRRIHPALLPAR